MHKESRAAARKYAVAKSKYLIALYQMQTARLALNGEIFVRRKNGETAKEIAADLHLTLQFVNQSYVAMEHWRATRIGPDGKVIPRAPSASPGSSLSAA